jgi:serine phosphatase RsbU (regulator of sigma subunit)
MLPARESLAKVTRDCFLIWEPRDIVGGDFFWLHRSEPGYYLIVGDCTGHGVPGAFMTLIACGLLDRHLRALENPTPGLLLNLLHRDLQTLLGQDLGRDGKTNDGFEAGVCFVSEADRRLIFAGAHFSLWRARAGAIEEIKGDKAGIGYRRLPGDVPFNDVAVDLGPGDAFYLATDGLLEQIGGARRRSFGRKRFAEILTQRQGRPMTDQREALAAALAHYQGEERRRDDVTVLGFVPLAT